MCTALFIITYIFIGLRQIPRIHIDRPAGPLVLEYFRVGAIITVVSILGIFVLALEERVAQGDETVRSENFEFRILNFELKSVEAAEKQLTFSISREGKAGLLTYRIVLLCDTNESRTRGLQGYRPLKRNEAALFVFENLQAPTFWMGSVRFAIDIIFIGPDKKVVKVYSDCRPGSLEYYPSGQAVKWVIETASGSGIRVGDRVDFK